jgi:hypothetical protein
MLRRRRTRLLTAAALLVAAVLVHPTPASAGAAHGTGIAAPTSATIGSSVDATVVITNASTPPESASTHTISNILIVPSCSAPTANALGDCSDPDVGAVTASGPGIGTTGTACEGTTFTIIPEPASTTGMQRLTPSAPVVLAPPGPGDSDRCTIELELTLERLPAMDALPAPGLQTVVLASSEGTSNTAPPGSPNSTSFSAGAAAITVEKAASAVTTQVVDAEVALGEPVGDAATLASDADPTGELAFDLYGPDDDDCSQAPAATLRTDVDGAGTYTSPTTVPTEAGTYRFVARYEGDDANQPISGACNDPDETVVVAAAEPPGIRVLLDATPLSRPEPGGTFSFAASVTNTSAVPVTITALADDVYGDVTTRGTCTSAVSTVLQPGDTYRCAYPGDVAGNAGTTQTDVLTGTAVDGSGAAVLDEDDAVVSLTDVPPTASVTKTALPEERAAPGGLFTFSVAVTNTSFEPVTITKIVDDVHGDIARLTSSTCAGAIGRRLAPKEQVTCTFPGELTGPAGTAETDVVTVTITDDDRSTGTASDDATIRLIAPGATPTSTTATTAPRITTTTRSTPTTAPRQGPSSLAETGTALRTTATLGLGLLGTGMLLTGLGLDPSPSRRRRPRAARRT